MKEIKENRLDPIRLVYNVDLSKDSYDYLMHAFRAAMCCCADIPCKHLPSLVKMGDGQVEYTTREV